MTEDIHNPSIRHLDVRALDARLHDLQKRAFQHYEAAAAHAEAEPSRADAIYAETERTVAPLIAEARTISEELARRLRVRAHRYRLAALVVAVLGVALAIWLATKG